MAEGSPDDPFFHVDAIVGKIESRRVVTLLREPERLLPVGDARRVELGLDGPAAARVDGREPRERGSVLVRIPWRPVLVRSMALGHLPLVAEVQTGIDRRLLEAAPCSDTKGDSRQLGPAIVGGDEVDG